MSNLVQNQNQAFQTPMLAQVTMDPQPATFPAQIIPTSSAAIITAGMSVKLVDGAGPNIQVDVTTAPTDGPVFGFIAYNKRKNQYVAGDTTEIVGALGVLMLKCNGAVARGDNVSSTNPTVITNDPTVQTTTSAGDYISGVALGKGASGDLIKVKVSPGKITASTAAVTAGTP